MNNKPDPGLPSAALRRQAERRLAATPMPGNEGDVERLLHELQVHQIELEMQNEELRTARVETDAALKTYADLYDFAPLPYLSLRCDSTMINPNHAAAALLGETRAVLNGMRLDGFVSERSEPILNAFLGRMFASGVKESCEISLVVKGRVSWTVLQAVADLSRQASLAVFVDITEQKRAAEIIRRQANFDQLTWLPNRRLFQERLAQALRKSQRNGRKTALMLLDIDRFKDVNDTLGHGMGDILLRDAARRLTGCVRRSDTVARLGGDEFTVVMGELDDISKVERVAICILDCMAEPFPLGSEHSHVTATIGIAVYPDDAATIEELLKKADQAMYAAKGLGRNRLCYFTPAMQEAAQKTLRLAGDLRRALPAQQLWAAYQPIVELATGAIRKAEALLRWQHPERGAVSPVEFIPIAEDTGLIVGIGEWVFRQAANQVRAWRESYCADF